MSTVKVDAKGVDCPLPLVKFKKGLDQAQPGDLIEIEFTCAETTVNLPQFCQDRGIDIVSFSREEGMWRIVAKKPE